MNYPFIKILEDNWQVIYEEYLQINKQLLAWPEKHLCEHGWEVFGLFDFPNGNELVENTHLCPKTSALIKEHITTHGAVGFSRLAANTEILPHKGYQGNYLRVHLGLEIPDGDCGLKVEDTIYHWQQGRAFVFDDRLTHNAWNKTAHDRVVLLLDFIPAHSSAG